MLPLHQILKYLLMTSYQSPNPLYIMHLKLSVKPEKYWACRRNFTVIFRNNKEKTFGIIKSDILAPEMQYQESNDNQILLALRKATE